MFFRGRNLFAGLLVVLLIAATAWALSKKQLSPADFTFINETEIKSVDPALIIGQPELRVVMALFEGLVNWDPKDLHPIPGVAESWEISPDQRTYTFHLRPSAKWSDGSPVTANDFVWQWRRVLDPLTVSQYSYQLWYLKNAERYTQRNLSVGDRVEIELHESQPGALPFARGKVLHGRLTEIIQTDPDSNGPSIYSVEIDGQPRRFQSVLTRDLNTWKSPSLSSSSKVKIESCKTVLLDFDEVGVKALDDCTLQVELKSPTPYFLFLAGYYPLFATNPKCVKTYGYPDWTKPGHIVTNGAFRLQSHRVRERIRLVKNDQYWNAANVRLNTVDVLPVESLATALNLYITGQVDWAPKVPSTIVSELRREKRADYYPTPEMTIYFYRLNCTKPPLDNPLVRKALALAVDKQQVVDGVTRGGELPALGIVPPGLTGYTPASGESYNPDSARKLLADAGYPGGRGFPKIEILYNPSDEHQSIAELIQAQWKETLGIDVGLQSMEWGPYLAAQQNLKYQVARSGWIGDYLDPNTFLDMWMTDNPNNETGWSNKEYDKLLTAAAAESDSAKRMQLLQQAETIVLSELPFIPIYYRVSTNLVRPYVKGWYPNLLDVHPLDPIWIDQEEKQKFLESGGRG
jgi:oligopeptide transport system substrate-binding protein